MAGAVPRLRWNSLSSASHSINRLSPYGHRISHLRPPTSAASFSPRIRCKAVEIGSAAQPATAAGKINNYMAAEARTSRQHRHRAHNSSLQHFISLQTDCFIAPTIQHYQSHRRSGHHDIQGEDQKKLDVIANELFCNCLRSSGRTGIIASEEEDVPVAVEETYSGNYIVVFDPIDGSANIDTSLTTGSIFGIYGPDKQCIFDIDDNSTLDQEGEKCIISVCQPGNNLLAAGYCLYSSSVVFTLSIGRGVYVFTLDPAYGEFILTLEDIKIPSSNRIYSFNEGNYDLFDAKLQKYLDDLRKPGPNGKPYSGRYIGCLVGEIHRMLLVGGIYGNPDNKNSKNGNLRLLYECAPMSYLVEQAGGKAIDGRQRILDIKPDKIHQRTSIFVGSPDEINKLMKYLSED